MSDRRDRNSKKTPPAGIAAQIAGPESFDSYTPTHPTPVEQPTIDENILHKIERRTGETKNSSIDALIKIEALRRDVDVRFEKVHDKIDAQTAVLGDVREMAAESVGQNKAMLVILEANFEQQTTAKAQSGEIRKVRALTDAEIDKAAANAAIDRQKKSDELRYALIKEAWPKILAGVGLVAAAVMAAVTAGRGC